DKEISKHCKKTNTGKRSKNKDGTPNRKKESGIVGKGYFKCSRKCRFYEQKEEK
ncbi:unnamed protein product, partial [marine sediment metagenome]